MALEDCPEDSWVNMLLDAPYPRKPLAHNKGSYHFRTLYLETEPEDFLSLTSGEKEQLKGKLRQIKIWRVYLGKNQLELGSTKPEVARSSPPTTTLGETFTEKRQKQGQEIIDWL